MIQRNTKNHHRVVSHFTQELLVCHIFDLSHFPIAIKVVIEMNTISHRFSQYTSLLFGDTLCHGCCSNSPRLNRKGDANEYLSTYNTAIPICPSRLLQVLRNLSWFAAPGFSLNNNNVACFNSISSTLFTSKSKNIQNLSSVPINRQVLSLQSITSKEWWLTCCSMLTLFWVSFTK